MKDFTNKDLHIGAYVIFITPRYRSFSKGQIVAFTAQNVRVVCLNADGTPKLNWRKEPDEILQHPSQLIKV
jgi:hypothetical protein